MLSRPQVRLLLLTLLSVLPQLLDAQAKIVWRAATPSELEAALPARAPVAKERIETEMKTASGIIDSRGNIIAVVVLITAGYSADGKYSHFFLVESPVTIGNVTLAPGSYVVGWNRVEAGLSVHIYDVSTGAERVNATARPMAPDGRVRDFGSGLPATIRLCRSVDLSCRTFCVDRKYRPPPPLFWV